MIKGFLVKSEFVFTGTVCRGIRTNCYYFFSWQMGIGWKGRVPDKLLLLFRWGREGAYAGLEGPRSGCCLGNNGGGSRNPGKPGQKGMKTRLEQKNGWTAEKASSGKSFEFLPMYGIMESWGLRKK